MVNCMETSALRMFRAVAETGSVSRAAEKMNCVQSNVTARLKKLEEELDTPLFTRTARGMVPTPAGRVLQDYAQRLLGLVDEAARAVRAVRQGGGPLALGSMETTAAVRLPAILAHFHQDYPDVDLSLITGNSEEMVQGVLDRRLDGALVGGAVDHPDLASKIIYNEELVLVHDGERAAKPVLLTFRRGCFYRAQAERWLRDSGRLPVRVMEFGTLDGILGCVAAGMGCTVLPRVVVERPQYAALVCFEPLPPQIAHAPTSLIWRTDAPENPVLRAFSDYCGT